MSKNYVITGGPCIGKTTIINILAARGYPVLSETARIIIEEQQAIGGDIVPWKNLQKFQEDVAAKQTEREDALSAGGAFLDRSIIDGYAYALLGSVTPPDIITKNAPKRYEKIFVLDPLSFYKTDASRLEDGDTAVKIHKAIVSAYEHFGYAPVHVPELPPEERTDYVVSHM